MPASVSLLKGFDRTIQLTINTLIFYAGPVCKAEKTCHGWKGRSATPATLGELTVHTFP